MTHPLVRRPNFMVLTPIGELQELFCKVCGSAIGKTTEIVQGKRYDKSRNQWIETHREMFRRLPNYIEAKILFEDGSMHVTHGCPDCLHENMEKDLLQAIYEADMDMELAQGNKYAAKLKLKKVDRIIAIRTDGGGMP